MHFIRSATVFFLALNLCLLECALYAIFGRPKQRTMGLILLGNVAAGLAILLVSTTRLSTLLFGRQVVDVDLISLLINPPTSLALMAVIVLTSVVWNIGYVTRWRAGLSLAFMLGLVGLAFAGISLIRADSTFAILIAVALGLIGANALNSRPRWALGLPAISLAAVGFLVVARDLPAATPDPHLAQGLPGGFKLGLYAQLSELPTALATDPAGDLYVTTTAGNVLKLRDPDGDGVAEQSTVFAAALGQPLGIVWHRDQVFISTNTEGKKSSGRIVRARDTTGDGVADELDDIVTGLPSGYFSLHQNNGLAIGPDERLYVGVGSTSDHDPETIPLAASIISVNLDGSDLQVFATGLRNPYGLAFSDDGQLYATDNGPDQLNYSLPYVPPDELNQIVKGGDYGFPRFFGYAGPDTGTHSPILTFMMRTVPTGLVVYSGPQFPSEYRGNIFVALWQKGPDLSGGLPPRGQRVARIVLAGTAVQQSVVDHDFVTGLQGPIDLEVGPVGELYIADMLARRIYRITYAP